MQIDVQENVQGIITDDYKYWFCDHLAKRLVRNRQHDEIIKRIFKTIKRDNSRISAKIETWNRYSYIRNAIVHANGKVTSDLLLRWPERFNQVGRPLQLHEDDLRTLQKHLLVIAKFIDHNVCATVIGNQDGQLLVREVFIRCGYEDPNHLASIVHTNLHHPLKRVEIQKALAEQRRTNTLKSDIDFDSIWWILS